MRVSQLVKVRALALTLGLVLVPSLAVMNAPPARADAQIIPLRFPGSAYPAGMTGTDLTGFHRAAPTRYPALAPVPDGGNIGKVGAKPGGIGAAGAVIGSFLVGVELGDGAASLMGLPTSGNTFCNLTALVTNDYSCFPSAAPDYEPNADVLAGTPGWLNGVNTIGIASIAVTEGVTMRAYGTGVGSTPGSNVEEARIYVQDETGQIHSWGRFSPGNFCWSNGTCEDRPHNGVDLSGLSGRNFVVIGLPRLPAVELPNASQSWENLLSGIAGLLPEFIAYFSVTHPQRPPEVEADPERWWRTDWVCTSGGGGSLMSSAFRESQPEWPGFPEPNCAGGAIPKSITWWQVTKGLTDKLLSSWEIPAGLQDFVNNNPDCAGGGCQLLLERLDAVTGKQYSCFANPSMCAEWFEDPAKDQNYRCTYGGKVVALSECNAYRVTFNVGTEGELSTPDPANPDPLPPVKPDPPTDPEGPQQDNACPPPFTWTSLVNPWWYYKGMTCALQEMFVPKPGAWTANINKINASWAGTSVAKWSSAVGGLGDQLRYQEAGCLGPRLLWKFQNKTMLDVYPFQACENPQKQWAGWSKGFLSAVIVVFGSLACLRAVGSGFGWKPSAGGDA